MTESSHPIFEPGDLRLDTRSRRLFRTGTVVPLPPKTLDSSVAAVATAFGRPDTLGLDDTEPAGAV